jgi:putative transposase
MPRSLRTDVGDIVYHVINRANARLPIFQSPNDYHLFEDVLTEAKERTNMRILSYCIMPNHWHLILHPKNDGDLSRFTGWLTMTHTQRWHAAHDSIGTGHLYQGRYKSFPVQTDEYFLWVCRYVERNPLRAKLVKQAQNWQWSSVWRREYGSPEQQALLDQWPTDQPRKYLDWLNEPEDDALLKKVRTSVNRGQPFGSETWSEKMIKKFGLRSTVTPRGRPKKGS